MPFLTNLFIILFANPDGYIPNQEWGRGYCIGVAEKLSCHLHHETTVRFAFILQLIIPFKTGLIKTTEGILRRISLDIPVEAAFAKMLTGLQNE